MHHIACMHIFANVWCSIIIFYLFSNFVQVDGNLTHIAWQLTTHSRVSATTIDDAVDQWRIRRHCCVETSGHHFEHLL